MVVGATKLITQWVVGAVGFCSWQIGAWRRAEFVTGADGCTPSVHLHPDDFPLPLHVPDSRRTESVSDATSAMSLASKYDEYRRWRIITQPSGNI